MAHLKTNRSMIKMVLLGMITFGIYPMVILGQMSEEINIIASRYDGKKTMNYWLMALIISPLTMGIGYLVWANNLSARMGNELHRRGINYSFGAGSFWGWNVLGSFIFVGPFIYLHQLCSASNFLNGSYNQLGN